MLSSYVLINAGEFSRRTDGGETPSGVILRGSSSTSSVPRTLRGTREQVIAIN